MNQKPKRIFISFANEAKPLASNIVSLLREKGYEPWIYTDEMRAGQDWDKVLEVELDKSDRCIGLITKSVVADTKRERVVWKELKAAIKRSEENGAYNSFLIPVLVNVKEIPREVKKFHCIDYDKDGNEAILKELGFKEEKSTPPIFLTDKKNDDSQNTIQEKDIEPDHHPINPTKPVVDLRPAIPVSTFKLFISLLLIVALVISGIYFFNKLYFGNTKSRYQTEVIDKYTRLPVKDVTAYILTRNRKDTLAISDPSGSDGRIYFEIDTFQYSTVSVNFKHKDYEDDRILSELTGNLVQPSFLLIPKIKPDTSKKKVALTPSLAKPKYFFITGITLTVEQRRQIERNCGYIYREGEGLKFTYDYNHDNFVCIESGCRFMGSEVKLTGNGFAKVVGKAFALSPA
ncbi:MAG: TIR domain-containing protein, partial [Bacteroidia bacterium]